MKIDNLQTFIVGEGSLTKDVFLTLDLIPIQIVFKYDLHKKEYKWSEGKTALFCEIPKIIEKINTIDVYQELIDMLCNILGLKQRNLISFVDSLPKFNFRKDETFYEYQYEGTFGRTYYTPVNLRNALKIWEQWKHLIHDDEYKNKLSDRSPMLIRYNQVLEDIKRQGIFTRRDYHHVTNKTLDKFIYNLKKK